MRSRNPNLTWRGLYPRIGIVALAALSACSGGDSTAPAIPPPDPTILSLRVTPASAIISFADTQVLAASKVMSTGLVVPVQPTWVSNNPDIITVDAHGVAAAVGVGRATISATAEGHSASSAILVTRPVVIFDALVVEEFAMIEYQYPSNPGHWYYAPHFKLRAASGRAVTLLGIEFLIPGIGGWRFSCGAVVSAEEGVAFNGEVYGDWAFSLGGGTERASSDSASVNLTLLDEKNDVVTHTVFGHVFAGSQPTAAERIDTGSCFRRYPT